MDALYYIKVLMAFIFVIAFMYLISWLLRKYAGKQLGAVAKPSNNNASNLKIIDSINLDYKRRLIVVDYAGKAHMILLSPNSEIVVSNDIDLKELKETQKK